MSAWRRKVRRPETAAETHTLVLATPEQGQQRTLCAADNLPESLSSTPDGENLTRNYLEYVDARSFIRREALTALHRKREPTSGSLSAKSWRCQTASPRGPPSLEGFSSKPGRAAGGEGRVLIRREPEAFGLNTPSAV